MQPSEIIRPDNACYQIHKFESLDSTNTYLKEHLGQLSDYTIIWTEKQTAGRGRFARTWNSMPGEDLTFSILLPLSSLKTTLWPNIPQIASLAIAETVAEYGLPVLIKWPNDLLAGPKKICGILCESVTRSKMSCAVLGIGINVNSSLEAFADIPQPATSLMAELQHPVDRNRLLEKVVGEIIHLFSELTKTGFTSFRDRIRQRLAYRNERKTVTDGTTSYTGEVIDINADGTLLFKCEDGKEITLHAGELSFEK